MSAEPSEKNDYLDVHVRLLCDNYAALTGAGLLEPGPDLAKRLYEAPRVVLSHTTESDPVFNYANRRAQELFEMDWSTFIRTPSRLSAEPVERSERVRLLNRVSEHGYIDDYSGVRISSTGRRFRIDQAIVWNLTGPEGRYLGQAAAFSEWFPLET